MGSLAEERGTLGQRGAACLRWQLSPLSGRERAPSLQETTVLALGKWWDRCHGLVQSSFLQRETTD